MTDEVAFMAKRFTTFWALVPLFSRRWRHVVRIVIQILMASEKLLLSETLITLIALIRFLVGVNQHVRFQMALRDRRVSTQVALETFLSFVGFTVQLYKKKSCEVDSIRWHSWILFCECFNNLSLLP